jgi:type I restriction enzyme, S subunit
MSSNGWRRCRLGDVVELQRGFDLPERLRKDGDVPIVTSSGINGFHSTPKVSGPGVVTGRYGSIGQVFYIDRSYWPLNTALWVKDFKGSDPRFIYYWLQLVDFESVSAKSAVPGINRNDLHEFEAVVPHLEEQRRIAGVLSALDDKIEHNRLVVARLAELMQARGRRLLIHSNGAAAVLSAVARFINGRAFTKDANGAGRPIIRIRELNSGVDAGTPRTDLSARDEHVARDGDILFAWSGSLGLYRWIGPESLINQHIFKVLPLGYPSWLIEVWISQHLVDFRAIAADKATTMGHIQRKHLDEATVVVPTEDELEREGDLDSADELRIRLLVMNRRLMFIRNALLPKLVSGAIRVPDSYTPDDALGTAAEAAGVALP